MNVTEQQLDILILRALVKTRVPKKQMTVEQLTGKVYVDAGCNVGEARDSVDRLIYHSLLQAVKEWHGCAYKVTEAGRKVLKEWDKRQSSQ